MSSKTIAVIGGGAAGMASAILLARAGNRVYVFEKDQRDKHSFRGIPQKRHSHAFLSRLRNLLVEQTPDILDRLLERGVHDLSFDDLLPDTIDDRNTQPSDDEIRVLACRRSTFDEVMLQVLEKTENVVWNCHSEVISLQLKKTRGEIPLVTGLRARSPDKGEFSTDTDLVLDASGRRSPMASWLQANGILLPPAEREACGIFYCSRFFRLRDHSQSMQMKGPLGADLGYIKCGFFPGDEQNFSITLAASPNDPVLSRIPLGQNFNRVAEHLPHVSQWIHPDIATPTTPVYGMSGLENARRFFFDDSGPLVLGLLAVGDSLLHTNPLYGRGCSLAWVHADLINKALQRFSNDPKQLCEQVEEDVNRELIPWYQHACQQDREVSEISQMIIRGEDPYQYQGQDGKINPQAYLRALVRDGFLPGANVDIELLRAFLRIFNLLDPPEDLMKRPDIMAKTMQHWTSGMGREQREKEPSRDALVSLISQHE